MRTPVPVLIESLVKLKEVSGAMGDSHNEIEARFYIMKAMEEVELAIIKTKGEKNANNK